MRPRLYVATVGEPFPLRFDSPKDSSTHLQFSEFGATFADLEAPAAADVVELAELGIWT